MSANLLELQEMLRNIPMDGVQSVARGERGQAHQLLAMDELKRRKEMQAAAQGEQAEQGVKEPALIDQYLEASRVLGSPPGMSQGQGPPPMPSRGMPPQMQQGPPPQMAMAGPPPGMGPPSIQQGLGSIPGASMPSRGVPQIPQDPYAQVPQMGYAQGGKIKTWKGYANGGQPTASDRLYTAYQNLTPEQNRIVEMIKAEAIARGIDPNRAVAQAMAESAMKPDAISPMGAKGIFQLMDDTGGDYGVTDPYDVDQNIRGGLDHMQFMEKLYPGDLERQLAAYNYGQGNVNKFWDDPSKRPKETTDYIARVNYLTNRIGGGPAQALANQGPPPGYDAGAEVTALKAQLKEARASGNTQLAIMLATQLTKMELEQTGIPSTSKVWNPTPIEAHAPIPRVISRPTDAGNRSAVQQIAMIQNQMSGATPSSLPVMGYPGRPDIPAPVDLSGPAPIGPEGNIFDRFANIPAAPGPPIPKTQDPPIPKTQEEIWAEIDDISPVIRVEGESKPSFWDKLKAPFQEGYKSPNEGRLDPLWAGLMSMGANIAAGENIGTAGIAGIEAGTDRFKDARDAAGQALRDKSEATLREKQGGYYDAQAKAYGRRDMIGITNEAIKAIKERRGLGSLVDITQEEIDQEVAEILRRAGGGGSYQRPIGNSTAEEMNQ